MITRGTAPRPEYASICVRLWPVSDDESDDYGDSVLMPGLDAVMVKLIASLGKMPGPFTVSATYVTETCSHEHYMGTMSEDDWHTENPDEAGKIAVAVAEALIRRDAAA